MAVIRLGAGAGGTGTTSATWNSFNITSSNANTVAVALVAVSTTSGATTCAVTYGGTSMKQLGIANSGSGFSAVGIYYLFSPATGVQSIVATPTTGTIAQTRGIDVAFSGVESIGQKQNVTTMAHTVLSCASGYALRVLANGVTTGALNQTTELQAGTSVTGTGDFIAVQSAAGAAPSVSFTAGGTASTPLSMGCNLTPVGSMNMVQIASSTSITGTSHTLLMPGPSFVGNTMVVGIMGYTGSSGAVNSISDTKGNTYSVACPVIRLASTFLNQWVYYAPVTVAADAGANTISVTLSASSSSFELRAIEYDGLDPTAPFDKHAEATAQASSSLDSGNTATTTVANELVVGIGCAEGSANAAGAGFTGRIVGTDANATLVEDKVVASTGVQKATGTLSASGNWLCSCATFKQAPTLLASNRSLSIAVKRAGFY